MHRRLRIPDLRKGSDSPFRTTRRPSHQRTSPSRRLSTPRIPRSGPVSLSAPPRHPCLRQPPESLESHIAPVLEVLFAIPLRAIPLWSASLWITGLAPPR